MNADRRRQIESICEQALARAPEARAAFLDETCAGDAELRREVESLLAGESGARAFLDTPVPEAPPVELSTGTRLGPYQVVALLGAGGMGEVYRARDETLGRDVALKLLPPAFAVDRDRVHRFEREARALAALNHPNIAQVFGLEQSGSRRAIVMELVGGRSLADAGRLSIEEALPIARQIAAALEAAHDRGVVHRDLKPANIKIADDGTVKVLDFGLAKVLATEPPPAGPSELPTATDTETASGLILGTAGYMSPEQVRGRPLDRRADIWAFGVVLFELLTGRRLFDGDTTTDRLAAVLRQEVPWDGLPPEVPRRLRRLLERCLERDPQRRLKDAGDARAEIEDILAHPIEPGEAAVAPRGRGRERLLWIALALAAVGGGWWLGHRTRAPDVPWARFTQLTDELGEETDPAISPDGGSVAYASQAAGSWDVYVRRVGGRNPVVVAGDPNRDESAPAWSPDGRLIAFHEADADGGIFIVGATGESPHRLTDVGFHPAWSPDGRSIAFCRERVISPDARQSGSTLSAVDVATGAIRLLTKGDAVEPAWSPSGSRIAFWGVTRGGQRDIFTIPASGGEPVPVTDDAAVDWSVTWAPDGHHLYFASDRGGAMNLWRVAIDEASGRPLAPPEPVTAGVQGEAAMPSLSADGRKLAFQSLEVSINPVVMPFDPATERAGEPTYLFQRSSLYVPVAVSPDGRWLALNSLGRREDVLVSRIDGSDLRNLTQDQAQDRFPAWSPDGSTLVFASNRSGSMELWSIRRDGSRLHRVSDRPDHLLLFPFFDLSTGRLWAFDAQRGSSIMLKADVPAPQKAADLPVIPVEGGVFSPYGMSRDGERLAGGVFSPLMVQVSVGWHDRQTGETRIWTRNTLDAPAWLPDSRRLVYVNTDRALTLVDTRRDRERVLRTLPFDVSPLAPAVSPDAQQIFLGAAAREADIWMVERTNRSDPVPH